MTAPTVIARNHDLTDEELRQMVGPDPHRPGPDRARLLEAGIPVWAIVGHLLSVGGGDDPLASTSETIAQVAEDYRIPTAAVAAALLYYKEHRAAIDTRLAINASGV